MEPTYSYTGYYFKQENKIKIYYENKMNNQNKKDEK
jgi:hypothetical protein